MVQISVDDGGVDIAVATHGFGVAQTFRHALDRFRNVPLCGGWRVEILKLLKRLSGKRRPCPRSKILCRKIISADFVKIFIDVRRSDVMDFSGLINILKQFLTGELLALLNDGR